MPLLAEYLRNLVERGLDEIAVPDGVDAGINHFRDGMITDGTVLRLQEFLTEEYKARHEDKAGETLHLLHNPGDQTIEKLYITGEKRHDSKLFTTDSWLHGRLVLFDPAYFKSPCFVLTDENDGYFVNRLVQSANPVITD